MKLTRGIAQLSVVVALGLAASAQTVDVDPAASPARARRAQPPVALPSTQTADVAPDVVPGRVRTSADIRTTSAPSARTAGQSYVTAGQGAEVDLSGLPSDSASANSGSTKAASYSYSGGPFINGFGNGFNGANTSVIVNGTLFGYGNQSSANNRCADDFPVAGGQTVMLDKLVWRLYQTGAPTTGTITGLSINLWNTDPSLGGAASQVGPANAFVSQVWSGAYRVSATTLTSNSRAIIDVTGDVSWSNPLTAGTYWVDVAAAGSLASGPWAPPVVPETLGNGLQSVGGGTFALVGDDFPFELKGSAVSSSVCYNNGPFINGFGNGFGGANTSVLTNGTILGYGNQQTANNRIADDFPVAAGQALAAEHLVWRAYQTGAPTTGTITGLSIKLWNTNPSLGGSAAQVGPTNSFVSQVWSGAYRVTETTLLTNNRAIIDVTGDMSWSSVLSTGTHWVDVAMTGSLASGPWAPPVVPETLGNGLQSVGGGAFTNIGDDFPFDICGKILGAGCGWDTGPFVNGFGNGFGGANTSAIVNGGLFGYGTQGGTINNRIADDFTVPTGDTWGLGNLSWKLYQTGAPTTGTITGLNVRLWNSDPLLGGAAAQTGPANVLLSQVWTGCYRVSPATLLDTSRAIMDVSGDMTWAAALGAGKYWVDVSATGALASGPWSPPTVPETFGNGRQSIGGGAFLAIVDDFPFSLETLCLSTGPEIYCTSKKSSCGSTPTIGAPAGMTSQAASGPGTFDVTCGPVPPGKYGLVFYTTNGKRPLPVNISYGWLCIADGTFRVLPPSTGAVGGPCAATYTFDFGNYLATQVGNAALTPAGLAASGGAVVDMQVWYRDPPNPGTANLSNAMRFIVLP